MGILARANGGRDGGHVESVRAKWRHEQRTESRHRQNGIGADLVAVIAQHQHAGHVLPSQCDQEQGQRHAQQGRHGKARHLEHGRGQGQFDALRIDAPLRQQQGQADQHDADHGKACRKAAQHRVRQQQHHHQHGIGAGAAERVHAELQQDAGQQTGRDATGDQPHESFEGAGHAQQNEGNGGNDIGADHLGIRRMRHDGGEKSHAGRGPGRDDGRAVAVAEPDARHAHADAQRPDPGRRLRGAQLGQLGRLEHQHEGAAIVDEDGNEGGHGGGRQVAPARPVGHGGGCSGCCHVYASAIESQHINGRMDC
ncbi:hypothetical protein D3C85_845940 [compost metagenome]